MAYDAVPRPHHRYLEESLLRSMPLADGSDDAYSTILRVQRSYQQDGMRSNSMANSRRNFSPYERHLEERRPPRAYPGPRTVGPRYYDQPHRFHSRLGVRVTSAGSRVHALPRRSTINNPRKPSSGHDAQPPVSTVAESEESDDDEEDLFEDCTETLVGENDIIGDGVVDSSIIITNLSARATKLKDLGQQTLQMTQAERTKLRVSSLQEAGDTTGRTPRNFSNTPHNRERGATVVTRLPGFRNDTDSLHVLKNRNAPRTRTMDAASKRNLDSDTRVNIGPSASTINRQLERPRDASNVSQGFGNRRNTARRASLDSLERLAKGFKPIAQAKIRPSPGLSDVVNGFATIISPSATMKTKLAEQRAQDKSDALLAAKLMKTVEEHQNSSDQSGFAREGLWQKKAASPGRQSRSAPDHDGGKSELHKARAAINLLNWLADEDTTKKGDLAKHPAEKKGRARRFLKAPRRKFRTIVNGIRLPYRRVKGLLSRDEPAAQLQNVLESTNKSKLGFRARMSFLKLAMMGRKPGEQKLIEMLDLPETPTVVIEARETSNEPPVLKFQQKLGAGILESDGSVSAGRPAKPFKHPAPNDDALSDVTWVTCEKSDAEDIARGGPRRTMKKKNHGRLSRLDPGTRERLYPKRTEEEEPSVPKIPERFLEAALHGGDDGAPPANEAPSPGNMMNRMRPIRRQHDLPAIAGGRTQIDTEELLYGARRSPRAYRDAQNNVATTTTTAEAGNWWNLWPIVKLFTEPMSESDSSRGGSVFSERPTITEQKYLIAGTQAEIASSVYSNDGGNQSTSEILTRGNGRRSVYVV